MRRATGFRIRRETGRVFRANTPSRWGSVRRSEKRRKAHAMRAGFPWAAGRHPVPYAPQQARLRQDGHGDYQSSVAFSTVCQLNRHSLLLSTVSLFPRECRTGLECCLKARPRLPGSTGRGRAGPEEKSKSPTGRRETKREGKTTPRQSRVPAGLPWSGQQPQLIAHETRVAVVALEHLP